MSTTNNKNIDDNDITACANCGKGEEKNSGDLKACTACKMVKYCDRDCQVAHRPQHKKACKKRAAELHDIELFKLPLPNEDCPICMLRLPTLLSGWRYYSCCGKIICSGCIHAVDKRDMVEQKCPFCRTPSPYSDEEIIERLEKRIDANDAQATGTHGSHYANGDYRFPQDMGKALELWHQAAELGHSESYSNIGVAYYNGHGIERDEKKANHYFELAAIGGNASARLNLGDAEGRKGMFGRAMKHWMIALGGGDNRSLETIKQLFKSGLANKDNYSKALQAYQAYLSEIKSPQRDEAAVADEDCKYY